MWQCKKWSIYIWKHMACTCKYHHQIESICTEATGKRQANYMPLKSQFQCFILAYRVNMDWAAPHELLLQNIRNIQSSSQGCLQYTANDGKMANITHTIWWANPCLIMPNAIKMSSLQIIFQTMVASVWESQRHGLRLGKHENRESVVTLPTPSAEEHLSTVSA